MPKLIPSLLVSAMLLSLVPFSIPAAVASSSEESKAVSISSDSSSLPQAQPSASLSTSITAPAKQGQGLDLGKLLSDAKAGSAEAQFALGEYNEKMNCFTDAVNWYELAATQGHVEAQLALAKLLDFYDLPKDRRDPKGALKWLRAAAEQGSPKAEFKLYYFLTQNKDGFKNVDEGIKWLFKSAEDGYLGAQISLSYLYSEPERVDLGFNTDSYKRDYAKARYWSEKAALQDSDLAKNMLGKFYFEGKGGPVDYEKARYWLEQPAAKNAFLAEFVPLAKMYFYGLGGKKDTQKAMRLLLSGCYWGDTNSCALIEELTNQTKQDALVKPEMNDQK